MFYVNGSYWLFACNTRAGSSSKFFYILLFTPHTSCPYRYFNILSLLSLFLLLDITSNIKICVFFKFKMTVQTSTVRYQQQGKYLEIYPMRVRVVKKLKINFCVKHCLRNPTFFLFLWAKKGQHKRASFA